MIARQRRLLFTVFLCFAIPVGVWFTLYLANLVPEPGQRSTPFYLSDRLASVKVIGDSEVGYRVQLERGEEFSGDEFWELLGDLQGRSERGGWIFRAFNITSWTGFFWVAIGLIGQLLFTGRMIVQWLASEKAKRPVVPLVFWWMSLGGSSMLIIYFIWRIDVVGILGQATGWFIYVRNLWLAHKLNESL